MRHLALVDPDDSRAVRTDDEYMFGSDLLVAPVISQGVTSRKVYLPEGAAGSSSLVRGTSRTPAASASGVRTSSTAAGR